MTNQTFSSLVAGCALVLLACGPARAQDAQYWTNDYGNRARLLGGAMVGSASDLSAVYYNPGRLALLETAQAFLTGYVFNYDHLSLTNPVAPADGVTSSRLDAVAALIAGELRFGFLGDSRLAYSFMNRHDFEVRLTDEVILEAPDLVEAPDLELLAGSLGYETRLSEYWAGFTWAKPLGGGLGLGISTFVSVRSQRSRSNVDFQELTAEGEATVLSRLRDYRYDSWRVLPKIGLGWEEEPWSLGLTVTMPGVKLWGSGDETLSNSLVTQVERPDGTLPSYIAVDSQNDIPSTFNSPWSVDRCGLPVFIFNSGSFLRRVVCQQQQDHPGCGAVRAPDGRGASGSVGLPPNEVPGQRRTRRGTRVQREVNVVRELPH